MTVRVRYAPSPTGLQHIGGVRTALFNYLYTRSVGGVFILRLEDTDQTRRTDEAVQNIYDTFRWLGIQWDEGPDVGGPMGPYVQSERTELYQSYAKRLLEADHAYRCFCSSDRLDQVRADREAAKSSESGYDRHCRSLSKEEAERRAADGEPFVVRLKIPLGQSTRFKDRLLGEIEWKNDDINPDPVLLKSDGFPTYHLANVVDDHLMKISHVMRAQEWLPSTPLHCIIYKAFGWEPPEFCHLPMVMGQDGKKLSKRHGATSVDEFRRQGYLPEALINYIALLGASYEEGRDIYALGDLASAFSLDKLTKAPAVFDYQKLEWFNGQYIRSKTDEALAALIMPIAVSSGLFGGEGRDPSEAQAEKFRLAMSLVKERASFLGDIPEKLKYLFSEPALPPPAEFFPKKADLAKTIRLLRTARPIVGAMAVETEEAAEERVKTLAAESGDKLGDLLMPLRVAITGARVSPPLFGSLRLLGPDIALARVDAALGILEASAE